MLKISKKEMMILLQAYNSQVLDIIKDIYVEKIEKDYGENDEEIILPSFYGVDDYKGIHFNLILKPLSEKFDQLFCYEKHQLFQKVLKGETSISTPIPPHQLIKEEDQLKYELNYNLWSYFVNQRNNFFFIFELSHVEEFFKNSKYFFKTYLQSRFNQAYDVEERENLLYFTKRHTYSNKEELV